MVKSAVKLTPNACSDLPQNLNGQERDLLHQRLGALVECLINNQVDLQFARTRLDYLYISEVLKNQGGNIGQAAKLMGIHRNTLSKRIKELEIQVKTPNQR